jgi:phosphoribosyl 1,2-cyclic phosphodiesterase
VLFHTPTDGDHSKSVTDFLDAGIPVLADESVFEQYRVRPSVLALHQKEYKFGGFSIKPFSLEHDVPNFGFLLNHSEMGKSVFITDTGEIRYSFKKLNNIIVEANFSDEIIEENILNGSVHPIHEQRVRRSHLSLQKCVDWLGAIDLSSVNNIVLIHLSEQNSDADLFRETVADRFGKNVFVASKNLEIQFNKTPF